MATEAAHPCRNCEYDLTGLPQRGFCPECGNEYDLKSGKGVLRGRSDDLHRGERLLARVRTIVLLSSIVVVMGCAGLISWGLNALNGKWVQPLALGGIFSLVLFMAAILSYLNERELR